MEAAGIGAVLQVPNVRTISNVEPALSGLFPAPESASHARWFVGGSAGVDCRSNPLPACRLNAEQHRVGRGLTRSARRKNHRFVHARERSRSRLSWVPVGNWTLLPAWIYAVPEGVFSVNAVRPFSSPSAFFIAGDAAGRLHAPQCVKRMELDSHFGVFACGGNPVFSGAPPLVISSAIAGAAIRADSLPSGNYARVAVTSAWPFLYRVNINAKRGSVLLLRQRFDPLWRSSVPARHVVIDGFANGWISIQTSAEA